MGQIIGTIIFGAVIGILARLVLPGKQQYGMIVTVVLGIAGALIGYWVWGAISDKGDTGGIDWIRWIISIAAAAVLSSGYRAARAKNSHPNELRDGRPPDVGVGALLVCPSCPTPVVSERHSRRLRCAERRVRSGQGTEFRAPVAEDAAPRGTAPADPARGFRRQDAVAL